MSGDRATVAILTGTMDRFPRHRYLVKFMIPRWEAMGFRVAIVTEEDEDTFVPADIALLHMDVSVISEAGRRLVQSYPRVINGDVLDIRKRRFSRLLVDRNGPDPGSVIVKSDWNCGGRRDFRRQFLDSRLGAFLHRLNLDRIAWRWLAWFEEKRSWGKRRCLSSGNYAVYASRDFVPAGVWKNPNLVVERFVVEREGQYYCCRHWLFCGNREVSRRTLSTTPVVKMGEKIESLSDPVPEELRAIREQLRFDYGKFDYGIVDGKVFLYDANRTPGASPIAHCHDETVNVLSEGLRTFLVNA